MRNFEAEKLVRIGDVLDLMEKYDLGEEYDEVLEEFVETGRMIRFERELLTIAERRERE